jgi:hypothetical protein
MDHFNQSGHGVAEGEASAHEAGLAAGRDLFALTDEQILEIEPEGRAEAATAAPAGPGAVDTSTASAMVTGAAPTTTGTAAPGAATATGAEPPKWLAEVMADPLRGGEARDFWNGVAQARQDAAAYREVFAGPAEARAAAERARALDQIDRAYFAGNASERSHLVATMLREDPAAFREMVIEGLRALEEAEKSGGGPQGSSESRLAKVFGGTAAAPGTGQATSSTSATATAAPGHATGTGSTGVAGHHGAVEQDGRVAAYASFEKSANEDLERSVGAAIDRTLERALPNTGRSDNEALKARLVGAIRLDVEKGLRGDRRLGEQVAQLLSGKRLNSETRAQVVRLIGERAEQLVPGAAKKILSDWTQTTLAAHRERTGRGAVASQQEVATVSAGNGVRDSSASEQKRVATAARVDYRKLSDEQILAM